MHVKCFRHLPHLTLKCSLIYTSSLFHFTPEKYKANRVKYLAPRLWNRIWQNQNEHACSLYCAVVIWFLNVPWKYLWRLVHSCSFWEMFVSWGLWPYNWLNPFMGSQFNTLERKVLLYKASFLFDAWSPWNEQLYLLTCSHHDAQGSTGSKWWG